MKELRRKYNSAKRKAANFMEKGQISAYLNALFEMNHYKREMLALAEN
ncbi:MAG: hypothetical protein R2821_04115 [Flavobacteriaceae bacterium]